MPSRESNALLKKRITREAKRLGATLVGYAPVSRWQGAAEPAEAYRPQAIWPQAQTVIVLGVPMLLPIIESTPSIHYQEMYTTANQVLDHAAYRLAVWLTELGHASIYLCRDGYGHIDILRRKPAASFSHVIAGKNAGLGTIGHSHLLLTPQYGPRVRLVSIFTTAKLSGDRLIAKELCNGCGLCSRLCPVKAFTKVKGQVIGHMEKDPCTERHQQLRRANCFPCGTCAKVCMVGADRKLYGRTDARIYLREKDALETNPEAPEYHGWQHFRAHGSDPLPTP